MVRNLNEEYVNTRLIYQQQKEYRKTKEGKGALRKANKKYRDSLRIEEVKNHGGKPTCHCCGERIIEFLSIKNDKIICYNCKSQLKCPHKEVLEIANR